MTDTPDANTDELEQCSPVEQLAEEYLERLRNGERPRISEYADAHPEFADEIRDVFRTLAMLEDFAPDHRDDVAAIDEPPAASAMPAQVGEYRMVRELGRGGMGVVYEAEHTTMRRRVALKVLHTHTASRDHDLQRFLREARSAGRLHHTNIVPVFEVGVDDSIHFYAMQCIRGQNLDLVIADLQRLNSGQNDASGRKRDDSVSRSAAACLLSGGFERSSLLAESLVDSQGTGESTESAPADSRPSDLQPPARPSDENNTDAGSTPVITSDSTDLSSVGEGRESYFHRVARVGLQVADALAYAHQHGILHRDIKPSNLLLDTEGTVWVTDFGLARSEGDDLTHTGDIVGTLRYMAPERFRGEADARSDIYSLGLTLYELCTLRYAFDQQDRADLIRQVMREDPPRPSLVNAKIPRDLETIVLKSIAREPSLRYPSASDMVDDLRLFLADRPIQSRRASISEQIVRWCRRNPFVASMLSCIVILLGVILVGAVWFAIRANQHVEELAEETGRALRAERDARRAEEAEREELVNSQRNLYEAWFRQAQSERRNQLTGRRDASLDALSHAAALLPTLGLPDDEVNRERLRLRNEAIAVFGRTGITVDHTRMPEGFDQYGVTYDHDYERIAASRGSIEIRQATDGKLLQRVPQETYRATDVHFSSDGRFLASLHRTTRSKDRYVQVWDLENDASLLNVETPVTLIRFAPVSNGDAPPHLAVVTKFTATVYRHCYAAQAVTRDVGFEISDVVFSPDGETLAVVGNVKRVDLWKHDSGDVEVLPTASGSSSAADWCETGNRLAVGQGDGVIQLFDMQKRDQPPVEFRGHENGVKIVSLTPDGTLLASTAWDGTSRLWDVPGHSEIKRFETEAVRTRFSRDGKRLSLADADKSVKVYRIERNEPKHAYFDGRNLPRCNEVSFHPGNRRLAAVATSAHVQLWDLKDNRIIQVLKTERTFAARFSDDGRSLITSGRRGLRRWTISVADDGPLPETIGSDMQFLVLGNTYNIGTSRDLSRLVYVTGDGVARVVDSDQPDEPVNLAQDDYLRPVIMSPDGRWVLTPRVDAQRGLPVWDADTGQHVCDLSPDVRVMSATFSPDGRWIAGHSTEGHFLWRVGTWDVVHRKSLASQFRGLVAFSSDNRTIAMARDLFSFELIDRRTFRSLAILDTGDRRNSEFIAFAPDAARLGITLRTNFEVWNLDDLRRRLREMDLDWQQPSVE